MSEQLFNWSEDTPVHEAVGQALGLASVCWNPKPEGVFDSQTAVSIGDELVELLQKKNIAQERPLLGLATNLELLNELQVRWQIHRGVPSDDPYVPDELLRVEQLFQQVAFLGYRTVDGGSSFTCPSEIAEGREDRCGLFSNPTRCSENRCSLVELRKQ